MGVTLVTQLARVGEISVDLFGGDQLVPMVLVESGDELSGRLEFQGSTYYPFRIGGKGGLQFPERCVQEVVDLCCKPLVLIGRDGTAFAVYYSPGPEAVPMSSVELELVAT